MKLYAEWPSLELGEGADGNVLLSIYDPKLFAYKELKIELTKLLKVSTKPARPTLARFTNEICANQSPVPVVAGLVSNIALHSLWRLSPVLMSFNGVVSVPEPIGNSGFIAPTGSQPCVVHT